MIVDLGRIPMLDIGTIAKVKQGKIRVLPGVKAVFADRIQFADGGTHPFDAIVLATGYTPGLESMIDGFETMADSRGRQPHLGAESEVLGLFFVGFQNTATGALREIALEARRVADSIKSTITSKV
jgi:indole-3-pyruvate monooxygenase